MKRRAKFVRARPFKRGKLVSPFRHLPLQITRQHQRPRRGRLTRQTEELKFFDVSFTDAVIVTAGDVIETFNAIPQGITESTRIGRKCTVKSIGIYLRVSVPTINGATTGPPPAEVVRIIFYVDHQTNGAAATVTGVNGFLQSADYQSFRRLTNSKRFTTLLDRTYDLNYMAGIGIGSDADYASVSFNDSMFRRVNIPLEFSGASGAIAEIRTNNIGFIAISKFGDGGVEGVLRLRFSDG